MGEYAVRKSDGQEIKIGTCEDMYYIRFEDRQKVRHLPGNVDVANEPEGCRFRLPFADEDEMQPGEYDEYNRSLRLYRQVGVGSSGYCEDFKDESTASEPGLIQLRHDSGLLVNLPCYHGIKLPQLQEVGNDKSRVSTFWNGKSWSLVLSSLRCIKTDGDLTIVLPVVRCRHCDSAWRYEWATVWPFIPYEMQLRLREYAKWEDPELVAQQFKRA